MKTKALIIILITLLIGGAIGFFTAGRMARHKIEHLRTLSKDHKQEQRHLLDRLGIEAGQEEAIEKILNKHIPQKRRMMRRHHQEMDSIRKGMFKEIEPLLTPEQKEKLARMNKRMGKRGRPGPRHMDR